MRPPRLARLTSWSARRAITYVEVLVAVLLLSVMSGAAFSTWRISTDAAKNRRLVDMAVYIAATELERMKAVKYSSLTDTDSSAPVASSSSAPSLTYTTRWYDRNGVWLGSSATSGYFQARVWIRKMVDRNTTTDTEDLRELRVRVYNSDASAVYEDAMTLMTFGGI